MRDAITEEYVTFVKLPTVRAIDIAHLNYLYYVNNKVVSILLSVKDIHDKVPQ